MRTHSLSEGAQKCFIESPHSSMQSCYRSILRKPSVNPSSLLSQPFLLLVFNLGCEARPDTTPPETVKASGLQG